jgi:serine/threonine protein kinase
MLRPDDRDVRGRGSIVANGHQSRSNGMGGIGVSLVKILAGEYRPIAELGSDGLSTALLAEQLNMERRRVLIRVLSPALAGQGGSSARLRREIATVALIRHPNIATVYECEQTADGRLYVVTEWLDGPSVASRLLVHGPLALATVIDIIGQCSRVLHIGQQFGVRNRSIALDSIFPARDPAGALRVRVRDFGLPTSAAVAAGSRARRLAGRVRLFEHGSSWADVHSLGLAAYAMLSGEPWLTLAAERRLDVPREVGAVLMASLRRGGAPFNSAGEFWSALRDAAIGSGRRASASSDLAIGSRLAIVAPNGARTAVLDLEHGGPGSTEGRSHRSLDGLALGERFVAEGRLQAASQVPAQEKPGTPSGHLPLDRQWVIRRQLNDLLEGHRRKYRIGDLLVETNVITEEQLEDAVREQQASGLRLGEVLIHLDYLSERTLREALCKQLQIGFVELARTLIDPKLADLVPVEFAERHRVLPIGATAAGLTVVMDDPTDVGVIADLHERTGCAIEVVTATHAAIREAIFSYQREVGPGPAQAGAVVDAGLESGQVRKRLGDGLLTRQETSMRQAEIEETLTRLQSQYTTLLQEHEAAMHALREQEKHFQLLLRERQDVVDGLERLARRFTD